MNQALGNVGTTITYAPTVEVASMDQTASLGDLVTAMDAGQVDLLVILGSNPVFTAPADLKFSEALANEVRPSGVFVTALCPGFTLSEFHDVTGTRAKVSELPGWLWMDSPSVAAEGFAAVMSTGSSQRCLDSFRTACWWRSAAGPPLAIAGRDPCSPGSDVPRWSFRWLQDKGRHMRIPRRSAFST